MSIKNGFSMVELLVAVLIFAIGLVGLAGLQLAGLRSNQSAYYRSVATQLAYDMIDRMRSNAAIFLTNRESYKDVNPTTTAASNPRQCETNACTPAELAVYDLKQWNTQLAAQLPGGRGIVCLDSTPYDDNTPTIGDSANPTGACDGLGKMYAIKIWWDDMRDGTTTFGFVTSFQLDGP